MPSLDIIIVNWNSGTLVESCLESVASASRHGFSLSRVMVVDNASSDGSAKQLRKFLLPITMIRNEINRGFAAACNQGAMNSRADYLLFLNPDMRLGEDSLSRVVAYAEYNQGGKIGILGIQLIDEEGRVSRSCARFPKPHHFLSQMLGLCRLSPNLFPTHMMKEWDHRENREVDHVMGAFFFIHRLLFEELNGFDERFFVYLEDLDLSLRAHHAGWRSYYLSDVKAYHKGGGSSEQVKAARVFYSLRSRILYGYKHFGHFSAAVLFMVTALVEPFSRMVLASGHCSIAEIRETLTCYGMLWRSLPVILKSARHNGQQ